jgi:hypothetical protein
MRLGSLEFINCEGTMEAVLEYFMVGKISPFVLQMKVVIRDSEIV